MKDWGGSPVHGIWTRLASGVLFPLHERLKGHRSVEWRKRLEVSQWLSADGIAALQLAGLRRLLGRAYDQTAYYRRVMEDLDMRPEDVRELADLRRLPFLTKPLIREHREALKAADAKALKRFNTGGSTGQPLIFHLGRERISHDVAAKWRATRWWGVDIGDPELVVWGSPIELGAQDRIRDLRDRLLRSRLMPAFEMSPDRLDACVEQIIAFRPVMLFGYPSSLALIARHAERRGRDLSRLGTRVAFVTAERLYDEQKDAIERVFGCPTANGYGGRDAGFIAHQCPEGGMHLSAEDIIVEIVDAEGEPLPPGRAGEVVVTHLATGEYPFVRYRTGDVAVLSERSCACGRGLPMLEEIQGRTTDFIVARDGTVMHGLALIYVVRDLPGIAAFKIIQESLDLTRVLLVPDDRYTFENGPAIVAGLRQRLGEDVEVRVEPVESIEPERSGKYRYVTSKVEVRVG